MMNFGDHIIKKNNYIDCNLMSKYIHSVAWGEKSIYLLLFVSEYTCYLLFVSEYT